MAHRPHDDHDDHGGLHRDLSATGTAMGRRDLLRYAFGAGALFGCSDATGVSGLSGSDSSAGDGSCTKTPEETAGPFPGDGSNGPDVLDRTGVVRSDIRSSFAGLSGTATGVPLVVKLSLVSASTCSVLADRAVYV